MDRILVAHGAYGRKATQEDWDAGKDFKVLTGPYFSIRDLKYLRKRYTLIEFVDANLNLLFKVAL